MKTIFKYSNILALLGVVVTVIIYFLTDKKKELTLSTNSFISLVDKNSLLGSGIKVSFDSVPVTNLYKVNLSLVNTGDLAVTKSDLIDKVKINFDSDATLLKYEINAIPSTIRLEDAKHRNRIELNPDLLNPTDRINIVAYYTLNKEGVFPQTNSRIIDGNIVSKNLTSGTEQSRRFGMVSPTFEDTMFWYMIVWNIGMFAMIFWAALIQKQDNATWAKITAFILMGGGSVLTMLYIFGREFI